MGGKLSLVVEFPDRPPVLLTGLGENHAKAKAGKKVKKTAKSTIKTRRAA